ncbi:OmpA family protein [Cellulomonas wangsupingiae]|uniref:OmpA family protein n=1 Tax=Cellulomonas wangsupingiae TaxID=2968085 RepID=A0ABY5K716_9CELL|nr:OmpA family protein [Cellulomonas wangsupingiae]MCC2334805.1 OmpA family protein [Cellulomonas wangsupingiae]MCM0638478.1 OmpA family protein [Cellulomonas wangsupingiae]UUI66242.1 OmpA family protein [Cellulomonas wangsupingiae]
MRRRYLTAAPLCLLLVAAAPTPPGPISLGDLPAVTAKVREDSVRVGDLERLHVFLHDHSERSLSVTPLATREEEDGETVVSLATDLLFPGDDASLSDTARAQIGGLLSDVPDGGEVAVEGHTDSFGTPERDQALSESRAAAVADAVRAARPDLVLTVLGYGGTRPRVEELGDDAPEHRAANRRVELRHRSVAGATPAPAPEPVRSAPPRPPTSPHVLPLPADAVTGQETRFPAVTVAGADVVVGVEELVVRGAVTQLSLIVRLEGAERLVQDLPDLHETLDAGSRGTGVAWNPVLVDRAGLLRYGEVRAERLGDAWAGEGHQVGTPLTAPRRFTITYPRLLGEPSAVDVVLGEGLPVLTGVDVEVER